MDRFDPGPQPAGRPGAPGRLGFVQAFCNSFWVLAGATDAWATDASYAAWMADRGFRAADGSRARAIALREALRTLLLAHNDHGTLADAEAALVALPATPALVPTLADGLRPAGDRPADACALALGLVVLARADGSLARLKACPHVDCGWVFHDASRNRSAQWCSMRICGNRAKGAAFRDRRRARN